jgi:DNA-binding NarL/FixJ family response regulator
MDKLVHSVRVAHIGGCYISEGLFTRAFMALSKQAEYQKIFRNFFPVAGNGSVYSRFSQAELRIIRFVCEGQSNKEIAENLSLTTGTVRNYISAVMQKAGTRNRVQMAIYAFSNGLTD